MYTPDSYLYETNLALLASLSDDEPASAELLAQAAPGAALAPLARWLVAVCKGALAGLAAAFAYAPSEEEAEANWRYLTLF
jgi:hypothetical protein